MKTLSLCLLFALLMMGTRSQEIQAATSSDNYFAFNQCLNLKRTECLKKFDYINLPKRFWEYALEYQYLNRVNAIKSDYLQCELAEMINCAKVSKLETMVNKLDNLQKIQLSNGPATPVKLNEVMAEMCVEATAEGMQKTMTMLRSLRSGIGRLVKEIDNFQDLKDDILISTLHGKGFGLSGTAVGIAGLDVRMEGIIHSGELAIFCAPGVTFQTTVAVGAAANLIQSLGCKTNADYQGRFLTVGLELSGELIGLPASVGAGISIGTDMTAFLNGLLEKKKKGLFSTRELILELNDVATQNLATMTSGKRPEHALGILVFSKILAKLLNAEETSLALDKTTHDYVNYLAQNNITVSWATLNRFIQSPGEFTNAMAASLLPGRKNLLLAVREFTESMNGCNAISGMAGVGLSLNPLINAGITMNHYGLLMEIPVEPFLSTRNFAEEISNHVGSLCLDPSSYLATLYKKINDSHFNPYETCAVAPVMAFTHNIQALAALLKLDN
jgi:hypothetical protein